MDTENKYHGIDEFAARLIKNKARKLIGRFGFTESDREDLEQEMAICLLEYLPRYKPQCGKRNIYISGILKSKVCKIIRDRKLRLREGPFLELDKFVKDEEGELIELVKTLELDEYLYRTGKATGCLSEMVDLKIDMQRVVRELSPELQEICHHLKSTETVAELSRKAKISRVNAYNSIRELFKFFQVAGLRDYL